MEILAIMSVRFPSEAIIAHGNFCGVFANWSLFCGQNARNCFFFVWPGNTKFHLDHTSKWAKSARNSLIWLKMKSERSSRKQHFFSHFEEFVLEMRWKVLNVALNLNISIKNENKIDKFLLGHVSSFLTTKYTRIRTVQRIFSTNSSKCEKKCCFRKERSDFILSQISGFLVDFAHFEV